MRPTGNWSPAREERVFPFWRVLPPFPRPVIAAGISQQMYILILQITFKFFTVMRFYSKQRVPKQETSTARVYYSARSRDYNVHLQNSACIKIIVCDFFFYF